jgi:serine/threonine protein phosphatase 1
MILAPLNKLLRRDPDRAKRPRVPQGERYYVVGDIHGRLDLFDALIDAIEGDITSGAPATSHVILLGDLIDRGPDSAGVIARAREWGRQRKLRILAGNHEEMFLESFEDQEVLRHFLKHGGRETILSYGLPKKEYRSLALDELFARLPEIVPQEDRDYLKAFEEMIVAGDYVFVHAGIDPTRPLDEQRRSDLLWIRERFLRHKGPLPKIVVHGHTIFDEVKDKRQRIGIDTGAFRSGILTALVLEGDQRRIIQSVDKGKRIKIKSKELSE